jgi:hypothetical protein
MDAQSYRRWRAELDAWLGEREAGPLAEAPDPARAAGLVLDWSRLVMRGVGATQPRARVRDRNRYQELAGRLPELMAFEEFSLAEYTLDLPAQSPGVRLWHQRRGGSRITLVMFPDVRVWRVDAAGRKESQVLLTLWLEPEGPRPEPPATAPAGPAPAREWRTELTDALCLPVRRFLE